MNDESQRKPFYKLSCDLGTPAMSLGVTVPEASQRASEGVVFALLRAWSLDSGLCECID